MSGILELPTELLERAFQDGQQSHKLPRKLLTRVASLSLQLENATDVESTHLYKALDIREHIEAYPEDFYFSNPSHVYVRNLVLLNAALVIDDLVVRSLSQIHSSEEAAARHLECLFYILKYRTFRRHTLRLIFDNLVYFDSGDNFYRFGVLDLVIRHYKESDASMADEPAPALRQSPCAYHDTGDLGNDNVMVLSNIIWEEIKSYLDCDVAHGQSAAEFSEESSLFVNRDVLLREFSSSDVERMCVMELLGTMIDCTGNFLCNRISRNQKLLGRIKRLPGIVKLLDKMVANFERVDLLSETILGILEEKGTKQSLRLVSVLRSTARH